MAAKFKMRCKALLVGVLVLNVVPATRGDPPEPLATAKVRQAWENAGFEFLEDDDPRFHRTFENGRVAALPFIRAIRWKAGAIAKLPAFSRPFGLVLVDLPEVPDSVLKELTSLKNLRALYVDVGLATDSGIGFVAEMKLQKLMLSGGTVTDAWLKHLAGMETLRTLALTESDIADGDFGRLKNLHTLILHGQAVEGVGIKNLSKLEQLRDLRLCLDKVDTMIQDLSRMKELRTLDLFGSAISDRGLKALGKLPNEKLENLRLARNKITDAGLAELAAIPNLQVLDLSDNGITDAGVKHLARLGRLKKLYLSNTGVEDAGLKYLGGLKKLEYLDLSATTVTDTGIMWLRTTFPKLEINLKRKLLDDAAAR
jgi:Leucine-rich repeat (LRR) protein